MCVHMYVNIDEISRRRFGWALHLVVGLLGRWVVGLWLGCWNSGSLAAEPDTPTPGPRDHRTLSQFQGRFDRATNQQRRRGHHVTDPRGEVKHNQLHLTEDARQIMLAAVCPCSVAQKHSPPVHGSNDTQPRAYAPQHLRPSAFSQL